MAVSEGGFERQHAEEVLTALLGEQARGLSAPVVSWPKAGWRKAYEVWRARELGKERWVYVWADGIFSNLRAEETRLCLLAIIGVNERGQKRFLAIEDGMREPTESWRAVLGDLK